MKDPDTAFSAGSKRTEIIVSCIKKFSLQPEVGRARVNTIYDRVQSKEGNIFSSNTVTSTRVSGYEYINNISVKVPLSFNDYNDLIKTLSSLGYSKMSLDYSVDDIEKYKNILLENMVKKAREKADIIAKAAGTEIIGVVKVDYSIKQYAVSFTNDCCYDDCGADFDDIDYSSIADSAQATTISDNITAYFSFKRVV